MEREFLAGIDFNLYVDKETYVRWVGLLEGLVMAKERGSRQWRKTRETPRALTVTRLLAPLTVPSKGRTWSARARSSSPTHFPRAQDSPHSAVNALPRYSPEMLVDLQSSLRSRCKRSAFDAFSPNSAAFEITRPAKRPVSLAVEIPQSTAAGLNTPSPLESLQCFSRLSLGSSPALSQTTEGTAVSAFGRNVPPQTLIASYRLDPTKPRPVPKVGVFTNWVIWVHALTHSPASVLLFVGRIPYGGRQPITQGLIAVSSAPRDFSAFTFCIPPTSSAVRDSICFGEPPSFLCHVTSCATLTHGGVLDPYLSWRRCVTRSKLYSRG